MPSPAENTTDFIEALKRIIQENDINLVLPTCEEVFYVSKYKKDLEKHCKVFCDDFEKMRRYHNKYIFSNTAKKYPIHVPTTKLINNIQEVRADKCISLKVLKPTYSRFGTHTLLCPIKADLEKVSIEDDNPWIIQDYISGEEYCTYSIAVDGELVSHSCYRPLYRAGLGSGIYFEPAINKKIDAFVREFIKGEKFTGQIGFDFILTPKGEVFVLECNPRATSGLHGLPQEINWVNLLEGQESEKASSNTCPHMVSLAMLTFGFGHLLGRNSRKFIHSFLKAKDPTWKITDMKPYLSQFLAIFEIIWRSISKRMSLKDAATSDIEWNGGKI